jgi:hypothetical protein
MALEQATFKTEHNLGQENQEAFLSELVTSITEVANTVQKEAMSIAKQIPDALFSNAENLYATPSAKAESVEKVAKLKERFSELEKQAGKAIKDTVVTTDGGLQDCYRDGTTITRWDNGVVRVENPDKTGYVRRPLDLGGRSEEHYGPKPEDNYYLLKSFDKQYFLKESKDVLNAENLTDKNDIRVERSRLESLADKNIVNSEAYLRFRQDMQAFEKRAQQDGVSNKEVARTYSQISKLLSSHAAKPIDRDTKIQLAQQVMHNASNPRGIDQGYHNTCNVATVEVRMYAKYPSRAAELVSEVARTGRYMPVSGKEVKLDKHSLHPDKEAQNHPPKDGARGFASQLFQVTAVNIHYAKDNKTGDPAKGKHYEQHKMKGDDTGERIVDYSGKTSQIVKGDDNKPVHSPGLDTDELTLISHQISGRLDTKFMIDTAGSFTFKPHNKEELVRYLQEHAKNKDFPVTIKVHTGNEPLRTDADSSDGGWHVVNIFGYDSATGHVDMDNQWGSSLDHKTHVHNLYLAMRADNDPKTLQAHAQDVLYNRDHNQVYTPEELERRYLQKHAGALNNTQYDASIVGILVQAKQRWAQQKIDGSYNEKEHKDTKQKAEKLIAEIEAQSKSRAKWIRAAVGSY